MLFAKTRGRRRPAKALPANTYTEAGTDGTYDIRATEAVCAARMHYERDQIATKMTITPDYALLRNNAYSLMACLRPE